MIGGRKGGRGTMANIITGSIGVAIGVVFFLYYAIRIKSIPLGIIIVAAVIMLVYDFVESIRENNKPPGN
jgi:peptidoglycan biosynthesis protein MviN/MurJ (putative lipid II flippase)